ncbi:MAG: hypothetical protein WB792_13760 [Desulfobacterales bacterium]
MKRRIFIFFFIFLFGGLISCSNTPAAHSFKITENKTIQEGPKKIGDSKNKKLSSPLYELALSPDPDYFAKKHNILLVNHRVRVTICLEPSMPEAERIKLLKVHNILIEKGSADIVRGLAPVHQLIPLSEEPAVRFIQLPDTLIKTRKIRP